MTHLNIHQTQHTIADFEQIFSYLKTSYEDNLKLEQDSSLHIFPELFLTGYPLQDLCLQDSFVEKYLQLIENINIWSKSLEPNENHAYLLGGLSYENYNSKSQNYKIKNVILKLIPGKELEIIYTKQLLPNYDIFDERKYFWTGKQPGHLRFAGLNIGLLICEDMWPSTFYDKDPSEELYQYFKKNQITPDLIVNLSASPFALGKQESRIQRSLSLSKQFQAPYAYVNRVGAEDEIIFDGGSFLVDSQTKTHEQAVFFKPKILRYKINKKKSAHLFETDYQSEPEHVWQNLFLANLDKTNTPAKLHTLSDESLKLILSSLQFSLQQYAQKNGFKKFVVALSGGMDSALVLTIVRLSLQPGQELEAIYMPSQYSAGLSYDLSQQLCKNLGIPLTTLPIKFLHSAARNLFSQSFKTPLEGVSDENIQSRLRGTLLYARSNQTGAMVLNTSNKSEIAVGYSTQYGDSVGAISILGDLYKSEIYQLAEYINRKSPDLIPSGIITRPPSAELRENQEDAQSLPPYEVLDAILEAILSYQYSKSEILELGFEEKDIDRVLKLYRIAEFKRFQFCPITKVKMKSFGFGYRLPISKNGYIYTS